MANDPVRNAEAGGAGSYHLATLTMDILLIGFTVLNGLLAMAFTNVFGFITAVAMGMVLRFFWDVFTY